jgi:hypothetical protein
VSDGRRQHEKVEARGEKGEKRKLENEEGKQSG